MTDGRLDQGVPQNAPSRKGGWIKRVALTAFSVLAVFVFWVLYPVQPPQTSLRGMLPESCMAALEVHAPQKLWHKTQEEQLEARMRTLPLWDGVGKLLPPGMLPGNGQSAEQLLTLMHLAAGQIVGMRNITALAGGGSVRQGMDLCAIFAVDNLGVLAAKGAWLFLSKEYEGIPAVEVDLAQFGRTTSGVDRVYFALVPGTRYLILANRPALLKEFRVQNPGAVPGTVYAAEKGARQTAIELGFSLTEKDVPGGMPLAGMNRAFAQAQGCFFWDGEEIGAECFLSMPDLRMAERASRTAPRLPEEFRGLALTFAQPKQFLALPLDLLAVQVGSQSADIGQPLERFFRQGVTPRLEGNGWLGIAPPATPGKGWGRFFLGWGVDNPDRAGPEFVGGLKDLIDGLKKGKLDFFTGMIVESLQFERAGNEIRLVFPLLESAEQPIIGFGRTDGAGWGSVRIGGGELPVARWDGAPAAELCSQGRLVWRYAPELLGSLRGLVSEGLLGSLAGMLPGRAASVKQLQLAAEVLLPVLDSFERIDLLTEALAKPEGTQLRLSLSGRLRLPAIPGAAANQ